VNNYCVCIWRIRHRMDYLQFPKPKRSSGSQKFKYC